MIASVLAAVTGSFAFTKISPQEFIINPNETLSISGSTLTFTQYPAPIAGYGCNTVAGKHCVVTHKDEAATESLFISGNVVTITQDDWDFFSDANLAYTEN